MTSTMWCSIPPCSSASGRTAREYAADATKVTIDFLRRVPDGEHPVRVARVLVPPLVVAELRDQLDEAWRGYHDWQMPEDADD